MAKLMLDVERFSEKTFEEDVKGENAFTLRNIFEGLFGDLPTFTDKLNEAIAEAYEEI